MSFVGEAPSIGSFFFLWAGEAFRSDCFTRMSLSGQVLVEFLELDKHPHPGDANRASSALGVAIICVNWNGGCSSTALSQNLGQQIAPADLVASAGTIERWKT